MIVPGVTYQFLRDQFNGLHNLETDAIYFAMHTTLAELDRQTIDTFDNTHELSGSGYTAGGVQITQTVVGGPPNYTGLDIDDIVFGPGATWGQIPGSAAFCASLYNQSRANKVIAIIPFGAPQAVSNGTFTVKFPDTIDPTMVIMRGLA